MEDRLNRIDDRFVKKPDADTLARYGVTNTAIHKGREIYQLGKSWFTHYDGNSTECMYLFDDETHQRIMHSKLDTLLEEKQKRNDLID